MKEIQLHITINQPPGGVDFGLQKGSGSVYETLQVQRSGDRDPEFSFMIGIKGDRQKNAMPVLSGPFVQGATPDKFVYIDVGACAGQHTSPWSRRIKVPLSGITWQLLDSLAAAEGSSLAATIPGKAKDGGPNCATVKPFSGWHMQKPSKKK